MITELNTSNPRGIPLVCRFGCSYIACKPSDLSEDALLGLPMREFWSSSVFGEQFITNLHEWRNDKNILDRLFAYTVDDDYLQANYTSQEVIDFISLQLEHRQLLIFSTEDKKPLFNNEHLTLLKDGPLILEQCKATDEVVEKNWVELEYCYADNSGVSNAGFEVYDKLSNSLLASGTLNSKGVATANLPIGYDRLQVIFKDDPNDVEDIIKQQAPKISDATQGNWFQRVATNVKDGVIWSWGVVQGDFNDNPTVAQITTNAILTAIPVVDQVGDCRDIAALIKLMIWDKKYKEPFAWFSLLLVTIGLVPSLGSLLKGLIKLIYKGAKLDELLAIFNFFKKGNGVVFLKKLHTGNLKKYVDEAINIAHEIFDQLITSIKKVQGYTPKYFQDFYTKSDETIQNLYLVKDMINKRFTKIGEDLNLKLGNILKEKVPVIDATSKQKAIKIQKVSSPGLHNQDWDKVLVKDFKTSKTVDLNNLSPKEKEVYNVMITQGRSDDEIKQLLESGDNFEIIKFSKGDKIYGLDSIENPYGTKGQSYMCWMDEKSYLDVKNDFYNGSGWDKQGAKNYLALPCFNRAEIVDMSVVEVDHIGIKSTIIDATEQLGYEKGNFSTGLFLNSMEGGGKQLTPVTDAISAVTRLTGVP